MNRSMWICYFICCGILLGHERGRASLAIDSTPNLKYLSFTGLQRNAGRWKLNHEPEASKFVYTLELKTFSVLYLLRAIA